MGAYLVAGLAALMVVNFFVPHAGAALKLRAYAPGLITSALVMVPVSLYVIQQALAHSYISFVLFVPAAVLTIGGGAGSATCACTVRHQRVPTHRVPRTRYS